MVKSKYIPNKENKNKKRRKKSKSNVFKAYIYKVLKSINHEFGISKKGMDVVHSIVIQVFNEVALESKKLMDYSKKMTLSSNDIISAVQLLYPEEISSIAIGEIKQSLLRFDENSI